MCVLKCAGCGMRLFSLSGERVAAGALHNALKSLGCAEAPLH